MIYRPGEMRPGLALPRGGADLRRLCDRYRQFLFEELRSASNAILSAELLTSFSPQHVGQLRDHLEGVGSREFQVVLYIRDPADFYLSSMARGLTASAVPPLIADPASFRYYFLQAAETWEQVFPGRAIVRKFHGDPLFDVVEDFAGLLKRCLNVAPPPVPLRINATISAEAMSILEVYRSTFWPDNGGHLTYDVARLVSFLRESTPDLPQTGPSLKPDVAEQIRVNHQADAEVLYSRFGLDLGLHNCGPAAALPHRDPYRVDEIVESVDPDIVQQLLLRLARTELGRKRSLPLRAAARAYRSIPPAQRPVRLADWLKSLM
jgi:hypothetical protein